MSSMSLPTGKRETTPANRRARSMTMNEPGWIQRRLKDAARITLALAGGAAFAYLAWNPQPPPPLPGDSAASESKPAVDKSPELKGTAVNKDEIERIGLIESEQSSMATTRKPGASQELSDRLDRSPSEYSVGSLPQKEVRPEMETVNAQSRGPPDSHQEGKEAPYSHHHREQASRTRYPPATTTPPVPSNAEYHVSS